MTQEKIADTPNTMENTSTEIRKLLTKLDCIDILLKKPYKDWAEEDKYVYGEQEQEARKQMREEKKQLRDLLVLKEKEKLQHSDIQTDLQPTQTTELINNNVPELEDSQPSMFSFDSFYMIVSSPPPLFKFNTDLSTDSIQIPVEPILLFTLFWIAMVNIIQFWYTLLIVELFFLGVSLVGIFAVLDRHPNFLSYFCWIRLIVDMIELIFDVANFLPITFGRISIVVVFSVVVVIVVKYLLKAFFFYCLIKYWNSIREGYVVLE